MAHGKVTEKIPAASDEVFAVKTVYVTLDPPNLAAVKMFGIGLGSQFWFR